MDISADRWYYSPDHGQPCQVMESQTLWGETVCRVWLPGRDSVVGIPASRLKPIESAGSGSPDGVVYVAAAEKVADALTQDVLLAPIESSVIPLPDQIRAPVYDVVVQEHRERVSREREKAEYSFAARRKATERMGLPQVRNHRLNLLGQEEMSFREHLAQMAQVLPEMVPLLVLRVEGSHE